MIYENARFGCDRSCNSLASTRFAMFDFVRRDDLFSTQCFCSTRGAEVGKNISFGPMAAGLRLDQR